MANGEAGDYLPGDPRYGLSGESLKDYYRTKPAQWAIYCWDIGEPTGPREVARPDDRLRDAVLRTAMPGTAEARRKLLPEQKAYVADFGERVIGYGHFVSDDGREALGTSFFMQFDDRAAADTFLTEEPMNKAGLFERIEVHRWSNSFGKRAADYKRKGMQQFLCTGPKTGTPEFFRAHLHAHETYFASYADSFIFRGPIRSADGADNIGTALLLELPDRAAAEAFWENEPFARNGGYARDARIVTWVWGD